mgnify:CR=1 FL=1
MKRGYAIIRGFLFYASLTVIPNLLVSYQESRSQQKHLALPVEVQRYDVNKNGLLDRGELERMLEKVDLNIKE